MSSSQFAQGTAATPHYTLGTAPFIPRYALGVMTEPSPEELEHRLAAYVRLDAMLRDVDDRLEQALRERQPLERVIPALLDQLMQHCGAKGAAVRTLDESLTERTFERGDISYDPELFGREGVVEHGDEVVLVQPIDVAGEDFGRALAFFAVEPSREAVRMVGCFCELLDNHLAAIAQARRKFEVIRAISDALKEPVLDAGIAHAIDILARHVAFSDLVLMFRHEDDLESDALRYVVYKDGALAHQSSGVKDDSLHRFLVDQAPAFLDGDDVQVRARFGITRFREEVLITGVRTARVVGRIIVTSQQGEFHTYDRELLDRFADYLRQRIVDFNREWKHLSRMFPNHVVERLLREEGYVEQYLTPRDQKIAILYCDIAGFTRISEGVLKSPESIGRLIDTWSDQVVEAIWETGGVFDKMVGDCVIGHWGPPFFEADDRERCTKALEAALRIRELTRALTVDPRLPELAKLDTPLDVATGLNFCPVSVGLFGPDETYTAFSSGMNNAARLQGVAEAGEILCMESFVSALRDETRFSDPREAVVKNVAEPLRFRAAL